MINDVNEIDDVLKQLDSLSFEELDTAIRKVDKMFMTTASNPRLQQIEELEQRYFDLQMCDHWDSSDYRYAAELREKIKELKGEN